MVPAPLVVGVPGGLELLVILLVFVLLFGIPLTILLVLGYKLTRQTGKTSETEERIEELEAEVSALKAHIEDEE